MAGDEIIKAYERLRAAVLGAEPLPSFGLATMRHEGMAAWVKASHRAPVLPPLPRVSIETTKNELTLLLASLVVTLSAEATSA